MFRRKLVGACAAALVAAGLMSPTAGAQAERIVPPEERDAYVAEFQYDAGTPPVVDGVGGLTDEEIAEVQDKIRQAEASGPPQDEIVPGEMWSDKVGVPEGYDKAEADRAEVAIAKEQSQPQTRSFQTTAERCRSFWLIPFKVCGEILDRYEALGGQNSWLLLPIEHQSVNPDGQGHRQRFVGGAIYQHPDTGAHAVSPMTMGLWQRHGWEAGWLGYPLGGEVPVEGSSTIDGETGGWMQRFQGGRVYRTPILEGFQIASINGLILDKWLELGGPDSELGFPIADEAATVDGAGRFSVFQYGSMYWHPEAGAHAVSGIMRAIWTLEGAEAGRFGLPTSSEYVNGEGDIVQDFQEGTINLTEFFTSDETVDIHGKPINKKLVDFLGQELGVDLNEELSELSPPILARQIAPGDQTPRERVSAIPIPFDYEPDENWHGFGDNLRDFCSYSPNQYAPLTLSDAPIAVFLGPCAVHDQCMDPEHNGRPSNVYCHNEFRRNLEETCDAAYLGNYPAEHRDCYDRADIYYSTVLSVNP